MHAFFSLYLKALKRPAAEEMEDATTELTKRLR